ncbi:hypothetical protein K439DRAFT_1381640 [Ramaria rubella]|nr:hypothetical protein K439DRAFT_1381640 [Ramaria rubella]
MASSFKRNPKFLCTSINMSESWSSDTSLLFHNTLSSYPTTLSSCSPLPSPRVLKSLRLYSSTRLGARHNVVTVVGVVLMLLLAPLSDLSVLYRPQLLVLYKRPPHHYCRTNLVLLVHRINQHLPILLLKGRIRACFCPVGLNLLLTFLFPL